jgi:hypothetical protein
MIKVGDNVEHTKSKIQGRVVAVLNRIFVEVEVDNDIYYWDQRNLKILSGKKEQSSDGSTNLDRDDWDDDFGYWDQNYSFKFADPVKEEDIKCICSSYDLFHFGCKCSAFELEQRRSRSLKGDE